MNLRRSPMKRSDKPMRRSEITRTPMKQRAKKKSAADFSVDVRLTLRDRAKGLDEVTGLPLADSDAEDHHRAGRQMGGSRFDAVKGWPSNGLHVHRDTHAYIEAHPQEAYEKGWKVHQGSDPAKIPVLLWNGWHRLDNYGRLVESLSGPMTSPGEGL